VRLQRNWKLLVLLAALVATALAVTVLSGQSPEVATTDPDPTTNPVQQYENLQRAHAEGDSAAVRETAEEMREEHLSRLPPDAREAVLNAPQQPDVPADTLAYIPPSMPRAVVDKCRDSLKKRADPLCELIVLHDEGKIRSGAFTASEVAAAVKKERE